MGMLLNPSPERFAFVFFFMRLPFETSFQGRHWQGLTAFILSGNVAQPKP